MTETGWERVDCHTCHRPFMRFCGEDPLSTECLSCRRDSFASSTYAAELEAARVKVFALAAIALQNTADALEVFAGIAPILRSDEAWKAAVERARAAVKAIADYDALAARKP